jgi:hypothetical protein
MKLVSETNTTKKIGTMTKVTRLNMIAMIEISYAVAVKISELDCGVTLYGLDPRDGTEWGLETEEDFDNVADHNDFSFGIEGELFGKPYGYKRIEHGDIKCSEWGDEVLHDEDGNCSLCGGLIV